MNNFTPIEMDELFNNMKRISARPEDMAAVSKWVFERAAESGGSIDVVAKIIRDLVAVNADTDGYCYLRMFAKVHWSYVVTRVGWRPPVSSLVNFESMYYDHKGLHYLCVERTAAKSIHLTQGVTGLGGYLEALGDYFVRDKPYVNGTLLTMATRSMALAPLALYGDDVVGGGDSGDDFVTVGAEDLGELVLDTPASFDAATTAAGAAFALTRGVIGRDIQKDLIFCALNRPVCDVRVSCVSGSLCYSSRSDVGLRRLAFASLRPEAGRHYTLYLTDDDNEQQVFDLIRFIYTRLASCTVVVGTSSTLFRRTFYSLPCHYIRSHALGEVMGLEPTLNRLPGVIRDADVTGVGLSMVNRTGKDLTTYGRSGSIQISCHPREFGIPVVSADEFFRETNVEDVSRYSDVDVICHGSKFLWDLEDGAFLSFTSSCRLVVSPSVYKDACDYITLGSVRMMAHSPLLALLVLPSVKIVGSFIACSSPSGPAFNYRRVGNVRRKLPPLGDFSTWRYGPHGMEWATRCGVVPECAHMGCVRLNTIYKRNFA